MNSRDIINSFKNLLRPLYLNTYKWYLDFSRDLNALVTISTIRKTIDPNIFYLGITNHLNLGDNAQRYCIDKWIKENYPECNVYHFIADSVISKRVNFAFRLKKIIKVEDIIIFQSGYTTQDLGGCHEYMHRYIIEHFPNTRILMMPQTIFFKYQVNKDRCAKVYNTAKRMLFLARDRDSYNDAQKMFPDINTALYPDIVTSLIGQYNFNNERNKILICRRNDGEKYYSEAELINLKNLLEEQFNIPVDLTDTNANVSVKDLRNNFKKYLDIELEMYSKYKVVITDRYHGTIFSLIAGTPVIVIKTNDHKVATGVDWFKGIYDDCARFAPELDQVPIMVKEMMDNRTENKMKSYFNEEYYMKLKQLFESL